MELLLRNITLNFLVIVNIFTFQYGATSTIEFQTMRKFYSTFTFQYGATSTNKLPIHSNKETKFTFQYGATSTQAYKFVIDREIKFTFQYGATSTFPLLSPLNTVLIYIPIWSYFYKDELNDLKKRIFIYIPIWSYFYFIYYLPFIFTYIFTFQYGATSTQAV